MAVVLFGKQGSGKTTIADILVSKHGFKKIVTYTTRPIRNGEVDGVDYHFISKDKFLELVEAKFFLEFREYETLVNGVSDIWYYGSPRWTIDDKQQTIILTPAAALSLLVFCLLYTPCVAAIASIKRELGGKWALIVVVFQCAVAWVASFIVSMICMIL